MPSISKGLTGVGRWAWKKGKEMEMGRKQTGRRSQRRRRSDRLDWRDNLRDDSGTRTKNRNSNNRDRRKRPAAGKAAAAKAEREATEKAEREATVAAADRETAERASAADLFKTLMQLASLAPKPTVYMDAACSGVHKDGVFTHSASKQFALHINSGLTVDFQELFEMANAREPLGLTKAWADALSDEDSGFADGSPGIEELFQWADATNIPGP